MVLLVLITVLFLVMVGSNLRVEPIMILDGKYGEDECPGVWTSQLDRICAAKQRIGFS